MTERRFTTKKIPGQSRPDSILLVEALGSMASKGTIDTEEEDLYSVFHGRARLMGWLTHESSRYSVQALWAMHETELTDDSLRVGFCQVGLDPPRVVPSVLPAVLQCLSDSVRRFGATVSGFQVTTTLQVRLSDDECGWYLVGVLSWFQLDVRERVRAVVHFDQGLLGDYDVSTLAARLEQGNNGVFEFRLIDEVPVEARIRLDSSFAVHSDILSPTQHPSQGLLVSMPEWTPSAAGWVLARVIDAAHTLGSNPSKYAVRISRVLA